MQVLEKATSTHRVKRFYLYSLRALVPVGSVVADSRPDAQAIAMDPKKGEGWVRAPMPRIMTVENLSDFERTWFPEFG